MDKLCTKCKQVKSLSEYNKNAKSKDGKHPQCKKCVSIIGKIRHHSTKDNYNSVYLIPESNYVGVTVNIKKRIYRHKLDGNITYLNDYRVLYKTESREEALELEELLHDMGYNGRHAFNHYR